MACFTGWRWVSMGCDIEQHALRDICEISCMGYYPKSAAFAHTFKF